jgi:hypothetical protein
MNELEKYFQIVDKINKGLDVNDKDLSFFYEYTPEIDDSKIKNLIDKGSNASPEELHAGLIQAVRKLQSDPVYKEQIARVAINTKETDRASKLSDGINLVLGATDIATSLNQILQGKKAAKANPRPTRPVVPGKDMMLQQALKGAQDNTFQSERALAPAKAEIQDQYQNDIQNAKVASTGQAGQFGAYAQLAANRRNRAAMDLVPLQDQVKARQQDRYDGLLGQSLNENQNIFNNKLNAYGYDVDQYTKDQQVAASLQSQGRENLRGSLYNLGSIVPQAAARFNASSRFRNLQNRLNNELGTDTGGKAGQAFSGLYHYTNPSNPVYDDQQVYDAWNKFNPTY